MVDPAASGASRIKWRRNPHLKYPSSDVQRPRDDLGHDTALQKLSKKKINK
jgi:hypothetical protein